VAAGGPTAREVIDGLAAAAGCGLAGLTAERLTEVGSVVPAGASLVETIDALERDGLFALRVGVRSEETPSAVLQRSEVQVDGPAEALELLDRLSLPQPP